MVACVSLRNLFVMSTRDCTTVESPRLRGAVIVERVGAEMQHPLQQEGGGHIWNSEGAGTC